MIFITELIWGISEVIYLTLICIVGFVITLLIIPYIIRFMKKKGYIGYDIHKNARPEVAESGGLGIVIGISVTSILLMVFFPGLLKEIFVYLLTVVISGLIGFIDDRVKLRSLYKIILTIFTGSALFLANYLGFITILSPTIPFLGLTRLTMIYPLVIPVIVAVFANASNMLEGYNGEGSGTSLIALGFLLICALIENSAEALLISTTAMAVLIPFFLYNRYPSKVFPGDIGTLSLGAVFACIALLGSLEVAVFCALLTHIINSFYVLRSVKGFIESSEIQQNQNDIILLENDRIKASNQKESALSLPRLILAKGSLTEPELVKHFYVISIICGFFSIIAVSFIEWTLGNLSILYIILLIVIFSIPVIFLLYKFPRVRGIVSLMILLLIVISLILIFIDLIVIQFFPGSLIIFQIEIPFNIIFSFILIVPSLAIWYYITVKYFWIQINRMKNLDES
ncbi:MAG: hypothetical protein ACFE8G_01170 [Candidatus Hermodarchaeota archaeon]